MIDSRLRWRAQALAAAHASTQSRRGKGFATRVDQIDRSLARIQRALREREVAPPIFAEWLLDNEYLLGEALQQTRVNLPRSFHKQLPVLVGGDDAGAPRVSVLARDIVDFSESRIDVANVVDFLTAYQGVTQLTMGELWVLPTLLRFALLEDIATTANRILRLTTLARERPDSPEMGDQPSSSNIPAAIESLRAIAVHDWKVFFESVSTVDAILRSGDPANLYAGMDFETRDRYRKIVEAIARDARTDEDHVARAAVDLAREGCLEVEGDHVGWFLIGEGRVKLERTLGARIGVRRRIGRACTAGALAIYLAGVGFLTIPLIAVLTYPIGLSTAPGSVWVVGIAGVFLPALTISIAVVHWFVPRVVSPHRLPKMDYGTGVPDGARTIVVVPALLSSESEITDLLEQLELNYLGNRDRNIGFSLLVDPPDAGEAETPADRELLAQAVRGVRGLNKRYQALGTPFLLLHRGRTWNESEGCWMGWERKRGKLTEFNHLILGSRDTELSVLVGDLDILTPGPEESALPPVRYVITLDADTFLPRGAACKLIGTFDHPHNQPRFDEEGRLRSGYTVLQPRVETFQATGHSTLFASIFEADRGLDLYSHAVSDVYQDLFGVGVYTGKGIYEVAAFERSLEERVPDNTLLSHDLFEGIHGCAGLVSDIAVFEDFPEHVITYARRLHRWVRGDWQIAPWLLPWVTSPGGKWVRNPISFLGRWQLADNLRRSLLTPSLMALLLLGWFVLPGGALWWSGVVAGVLGLPVLLGTTLAVRPTALLARSGRVAGPGRLRGVGVSRWLLAIVLLPYQAAVELDAITRSLVRVVITRRHLLQWTTAAGAARTLHGHGGYRIPVLLPLAGVVALATLTVALRYRDPAQLLQAAPILGAWLLAPVLALWISHRSIRTPSPPSELDVIRLRGLARRTWGFFEDFVGPEDHWLPPDNYQEEPHIHVAHRTSPTNIGLFLMSVLSAYDLGYLNTVELLAALSNTTDTMQRLRRHRGHFLNWYDTRSTAPLSPEYVSTVDSGNLAAALICVARGAKSISDGGAFPRDVRAGLADALDNLLRLIKQVAGPDSEKATVVLGQVETMISAMRGPATSPAEAVRAHHLLIAEHLPSLEFDLSQFIEEASNEISPTVLSQLRSWVTRVDRQATAGWSEIKTLTPWLTWSGAPLGRADLETGPVGDAWAECLGELPMCSTLRDVAAVALAAREKLEEFRRIASPLVEREEALDQWVRELSKELDASARNARALLDALELLRRRADDFVTEMNFAFLFDPSRKLFCIGYNLSAQELDRSFYDLLASEARVASLIAIAKGEVPVEHWLHLGRPFGTVAGRAVLLSWSGTMFEYLMPLLVMRPPGGSLLNLTCEAAVRAQARYGNERRAPWGISESSYHRIDTHGTYQYRAFGLASLGLRRQTWDRLVVAPYASLLALPLAPRLVLANIDHLTELGVDGRYGLYEAVDFGRQGGGVTPIPRVVRSFMSHHQGMILVTLGNYLTPASMPRRFQGDPRIAAVEFLLFEGAPGRVPLEPPRTPAPKHPVATPAGVSRVDPWTVPVDAPHAEVQVLSNGSLSTLITSRGGGGLRWRGMQVTRWEPDPTIEKGGPWIYLRDLESGDLWAPTAAPVQLDGVLQLQASFSTHMAEFQASLENLEARLCVTVAPDSDVELRRVTLHNTGGASRRIAVASYGEVSLADPQEDRRHPAFQKLFVESAPEPGGRCVVFHRRRAAADELPVYLAHAVALAAGSGVVRGIECDRNRFLGRLGSLGRPEGFASDAHSEGSTGATLDPIFSLRVDVEIEPDGAVELAFLTSVGRSATAVREALSRFSTLAHVRWGFEEARMFSESRLNSFNLSPEDAQSAQALLTATVFPYHDLRIAPQREGETMAGRPALWSLGISGDLPILLLTVSGEDRDRLRVDQFLRMHAYWRQLGIQVDLAVLDESEGSYQQSLRDWVEQRVLRTEGPEGLRVPGGVHPLTRSHLNPQTLAALTASAALVLGRDSGALSPTMVPRSQKGRLPSFVPVPSSPPVSDVQGTLPRRIDLLLESPWGGFTPGRGDYVIRLEPGSATPAPWINVIANPGFGFTISERGAGYTWVENSGEQRLTTWTNDPVLDTPSEAIYLRDEETGNVWSPLPGPRPGPGPYEICHGVGVTSFRHESHGLDQRISVFAHASKAVKVSDILLKNVWTRPRRLTLTYFAEWVLGGHRSTSGPHIWTEFDAETGVLVARDFFSKASADKLAFLASSARVHGWTCDREEFLGSPCGLSNPQGLRRVGLEGSSGWGLDPCAALQVHVDLPPETECRLQFFLGSAQGMDAVRSVIRELRGKGAVDSALVDIRESWDEILSTIKVSTPDKGLDQLLNRWLLYQTVASRLFARTGLYQSSGAFGFRDQLQDVLALMLASPERVRSHILDSARHQFLEGDVLHWWHPPEDLGVRTLCSDDLLWLPYVVVRYIEATGDLEFLEERVPFIEGPPLHGETERYGSYPRSQAEESVFEHCMRALRCGLTSGPHGLPLIRAFDWNDGMNGIGIQGRGESIWLAWFAYDVAAGFARLCDATAFGSEASWLREEAERVRRAAEEWGWDGRWYRRAVYDDGTPVGAAESEECTIDSIAQSWAVLSGGGDEDRGRTALESVDEHLVDRKHRLVRLLTPPFDKTPRWPGYIKAYPPGIRENGGQYTHAATWVGMAQAKVGNADAAYEIFHLLNPIERSRDPTAADQYRVEPYVVAGDVGGAEPHVGRGGWTWYTGSAAWLYRLGLEGILGVVPEEGGLRIDPCIPASWPGFSVDYSKRGTRFQLRIMNPDGVSQGVRHINLDGNPLDSNLVPIHLDGTVHHVDVWMGGSGGR